MPNPNVGDALKHGRKALPPAGHKSAPRVIQMTPPPKGSFREPRDTRHVLGPEDKGYRGRYDKAEYKQAWQQAHANRSQQDRDHQFRGRINAPMNRLGQSWQDDEDRAVGVGLVGLLGTGALTGLTTGELMRHQVRRDNKNLRRKNAQMRQGVGKAYVPREPGKVKAYRMPLRERLGVRASRGTDIAALAAGAAASKSPKLEAAAGRLERAVAGERSPLHFTMDTSGKTADVAHHTTTGGLRGKGTRVTDSTLSTRTRAQGGSGDGAVTGVSLKAVKRRFGPGYKVKEAPRLGSGWNLRKAWNKDDPFMWEAEPGRKGAHKVTVMGEEKKRHGQLVEMATGPKPEPDSSLAARVGRSLRSDHPKVKRNSYLVLGGLTGSLALGVPRVVGPSKENRRLRAEQRQLSGMRKSLVEKKRGAVRAVRPPGGWPKHEMTPEELADQAAKRPLREAKARAAAQAAPTTGPAVPGQRSPLFTGRRILIGTGVTAAGAGGYGVLASQRQSRQKRELASVGKSDTKDRRREEGIAALGVAGTGAAASPVGQRVLTKPNPMQRDVRSWLNDSRLHPKHGMGRIRSSQNSDRPSPLAREHAKAKPSSRHLYRGAADLPDVKPGDEHDFDMHSFSEKERQGQKFARKRARQNGGRPTVLVMEPGARSTSLRGKYDAQTDTFGTHRRKAEHLVSGKGRVTQVREAGGMRYVHMASVVKGLTQAADRFARVLERNKHNMVGPAAGLAIGGGAVEGRRRMAREQERSSSHVRAVPAAAAGALGYAGFKRHGMRLKAEFDEASRGPAEGMTASQRRKIERDHRHKHGIPGKPGAEQKRAIERTPEYSRTYPRELPGSNIRRRLGHMSGRKGMAMEAASFAVPAAVVGYPRRKLEVEKRQFTAEMWEEEQRRRGRAARRNDKRQTVLGGLGIAGAAYGSRKRSKPERALMLIPGIATAGEALVNLKANEYGDVRKGVTYGYMEERRNRKRTAQFGAGVALATAGAAHVQVGRHVDRGVKLAYVKDKDLGDSAKTATDALRTGRNQVRRATGQATNVLRGRVPGFGTALDVIPKKMRARVGVGAGALLAARALPTHDERFVPYRWS